MDHATDPGLTSALRARGYRVRGPVGVGSRGPAWAATSADGERVVVTVLDLDRTLAERRAVLDRIERLREVRHPHLASLVDVVALDGHRTALVATAVEGPTVGTVLAVRPRWPAGEVVTLVVPLADALASLHRAGLVHGDVTPENVVLGPGGHPVLVDVGGIATPGAGTRGFAPPGRDRGPASDVFALARLGLAALGRAEGRLREADDGALVEVLETGCSSAPAERPSPGELAARCFDAAPAVPVRLPDSAVLARAALTRLTEEPPDRTLPDPRVQRRRAIVVRAAGAVASVGLVIALVGVLGGADDPASGEAEHGPGFVAAPSESPRPGAPAEENGAPAEEDGSPAEEDGSAADDPVASQAVAAAVALTELRAAVLASMDVERLTEVVAPGSAAHTADEALMSTLVEGGDALEVRVEVTEARWLARREGSELVLVTARYRASRGTGLPEPRTVVLALRETVAGWRVADVVAPDDVPELTASAGPLAG